MITRARLRRALPYLGAGLAGFVLAWALIAFVAFPAGTAPQDARVPNVIGLPFDEAVLRLQQAGFKGERGEMRLQAAAPRLTVLQQTPEARSVQQLGTAVTLDLSAGVQSSAVPDVTGFTRERADPLLAAAGFTIAEDVAFEVSDQARGTVIETRPRAGTRVSAPAVVALTISAGPANVSVPDLKGRTVEEARVLLEQLGLVLGDITVAGGGDLRPGATVVAQIPAAATAVVAASRVNIFVSTGTGR